MPDPNVHSPAWEAELPAPFSVRGARVGAAAGARELGATLYELDPGGTVSPYHLHHGAHQVRNESSSVARVLLVSTKHVPDVAEHVDTGATLALTGEAEGKVFPGGTDKPFQEMVVSAIEAGRKA